MGKLGWPDHPAQLQRDVRRQAHVRILEVVAEDLGRHSEPLSDVLRCM